MIISLSIRFDSDTLENLPFGQNEHIYHGNGVTPMKKKFALIGLVAASTMLIGCTSTQTRDDCCGTCGGGEAACCGTCGGDEAKSECCGTCGGEAKAECCGTCGGDAGHSHDDGDHSHN